MNLERKTYSDPLVFRKERIRLIRDAISRNGKTARIPLFSNTWTWKYLDAGYSLRECIYDYDKAYDAFCEHHEKYEMDIYVDMGVRNPIRVTDAYGESFYVIDDEKNYMNIRDFNLMDEDDYDALISDGPFKFFFERAVPYRFGITDREVMKEKYGAAAREYVLFSEHTRKIANQYSNVYGVPGLGPGKFGVPMDWLFWGLRGMKGTCLDMRRATEKFQEALDVLHNYSMPGFLSTVKNYDPEDGKNAVFGRITALAHTMMSAKQFEKYSWPYYKQFFDVIRDKEWYAWVYLEGTFGHLTDYIREIAPGRVCMLMDQDDPVWIKEKLPNIAICGSYPVDLLQNGTKQECLDKAKELIDKLAYDGGYIFSTNKMMSFPQDGKGENFKAVVDFVRDYKF